MLREMSACIYYSWDSSERRMPMNRGEWSEPYVALKLLGEQKIYMANEHGNINLSEWMTVLRLVRQETKERQVSYTCRTDMGDVVIEVNKVPVAYVKATEFQNKAETLKNDILYGTGASFNVSKELMDFLPEIEMTSLKAKSDDKSDVFLDTHDPRSGIDRENIGFSIKSEMGKDPTLFNTSKASAVVYKVVGLSDELMKQVNSLVDEKGHAAVSDRCDLMIQNGCTLQYQGYEYAKRAKCQAFTENLDLINPRLPEVIEWILRNHFVKKNNDRNIIDIVNMLIDDNPCKLISPQIKYLFMIKQFLYAAYCGMTAATLWNGSSRVKGGYITVKKNGDVVANYAMESDAFKNYLYEHCYMDYPSTDAGHGDYGKVYAKDGEYYFNLNFQIRIR